MKTRKLILEDGTVFEGTAFGSDRQTVGETVFTTSMTGYQELISDPSSYGQILVMTFPLVGNYGINRDDFESIGITANGLVVREIEHEPSNFRSSMTLGQVMAMKGIPGIAGIDTRKLTRILRDKGSLRGVMTAADEDVNVEEILEQLKPSKANTNVVEDVSTKSSYPGPGRGHRVVVIDFGVKHGILRELTKRDCDVVVVPYNTPATEITALFPDGILLSNGPGNPEDVPEAIETIKELIGQVPMFGIGLGHQLFALANGASVTKMKNGHRGSNQPVRNLAKGRSEFTFQNHGYAVDESSLLETELEVTYRALNDNSVEGLKHTTAPAFSVQFHPEGSPGPEDTNYVFDQFIELMNSTSREEKPHAKTY